MFREGLVDGQYEDVMTRSCRSNCRTVYLTQRKRFCVVKHTSRHDIILLVSNESCLLQLSSYGLFSVSFRFCCLY
jgi:hypothetical protein